MIKAQEDSVHLKGLILVNYLTDLPDGEGIVDVHFLLLFSVIFGEQEGWFLPVILPGG